MPQSHLIGGDIIALHDHQTIYFAIPKVANSSMKALCADLVGSRLDERFLARFWSDQWKPRIFREAKARSYLERQSILLSNKQLAKYDNYWKFCLVRNPWDRLVSCWKQKIDREEALKRDDLNGVARCLDDLGMFYPGMSFEKFVGAVAEISDEDANRHFRSQHTFVTNEAGELIVDFVGRMESLEADLGYVFRTTGIPRQKIPHLLKTRHKPYPDYYCRETRDIVANRFARDISIFEYSFDSSGTGGPRRSKPASRPL